MSKAILSLIGSIFIFLVGLLVNPDFEDGLSLEEAIVLFWGYAVIHIAATFALRLHSVHFIKEK